MRLKLGFKSRCPPLSCFPCSYPWHMLCIFNVQTTTTKDLNLLPNWRFLHQAGFGAIYLFFLTFSFLT